MTVPSGSPDCTICEAGSKCEDGTKTVCEDGFYSTNGSSNCYQCESGTFSETNGSSSCTDCPSGYECSLTAKNICDAGYYSEAKSTDCQLCLNGTYSVNQGKITQSW